MYAIVKNNIADNTPYDYVEIYYHKIMAEHSR